MGIRRYKPTTPGRRGATVSDFAELTAGREPEKSLLVPQAAARAAATTRASSPRGIAAAATSGMYRADRLPPQQGRRAGQGAFDPVRSEPHCPHRPAALRRRREALHPRPRRAEGRRTKCMSGPDAPPSVGNCLPLREHSAGHDDPQHRDAARPRRRACAARPAPARRWPPARPTGRRSRCPAAKFAACRRPAGRRSARSATPTT